jgi:adenosylcobinamide-GDP ribazoletransferase
MKSFFEDLQTAVSFLTRIPMPHPEGSKPSNFARSAWLFPLVGGAIGTIVAMVNLAFRAVNLPSVAAAALALGFGALLTGALHEDGLADVADGFGGGKDRNAKLEIMRDSRLGTYGALILMVAFVAKTSAIAATQTEMAVRGLIAAHALSRGVLPLMSLTVRTARRDGLAANAGRASPAVAAAAGLVALAIAFLALPWELALSAALLVGASAAAMAWIAHRQIGGLTGDVLGGTQQVSETAILLLIAASHP